MVNPTESPPAGATVVVDPGLRPSGSTFTVLASTAEAAGLPTGHPVGSQVPVQRRVDGTAYAAIRDLGVSEALVLVNRR